MASRSFSEELRRDLESDGDGSDSSLGGDSDDGFPPESDVAAAASIAAAAATPAAEPADHAPALIMEGGTAAGDAPGERGSPTPASRKRRSDAQPFLRSIAPYLHPILSANPCPDGLDALPDELMLFIFSFLLPSAVDMCAVASTCVRWRRIGNDNALWRPLLEVAMPRVSLALASHNKRVSEAGGVDGVVLSSREAMAAAEAAPRRWMDGSDFHSRGVIFANAPVPGHSVAFDFSSQGGLAHAINGPGPRSELCLRLLSATSASSVVVGSAPVLTSIMDVAIDEVNDMVLVAGPDVLAFDARDAGHLSEVLTPDGVRWFAPKRRGSRVRTHGGRILFRARDGYLHIYTMTEDGFLGQPRTRLVCPDTAIDAQLNDTFLATMSRESPIMIYDLTTRKPIFRIRSGVPSRAFKLGGTAADEHMLVAGGSSGVSVFDLRTRDRVAKVRFDGDDDTDGWGQSSPVVGALDFDAHKIVCGGAGVRGLHLFDMRYLESNVALHRSRRVVGLRWRDLVDRGDGDGGNDIYADRLAPHTVAIDRSAVIIGAGRHVLRVGFNLFAST